jgi:hypothetical protein
MRAERLLGALNGLSGCEAGQGKNNVKTRALQKPKHATPHPPVKGLPPARPS